MVKNLPANAGDTGSIPVLGRSHTLWSNYDHVTQLLSLCPRTGESQLLSPCVTTTKACTPGFFCVLQKHNCYEKPMHHNEERPPPSETRESLCKATKTQGSQKMN